jgi:redox-sensing transcriptional repressor
MKRCYGAEVFMIRGKDGTVIPKVVIERLPRYYRYFDWLDGKVEKISSKRLGEYMGASASQVRLDLSYFGDFGQQGYGYNVRKLKRELGNILSINSETSFIIVGAGNIGRAMTRYKAFANAGFILQAIFDINPSLRGQIISGVKIHHTDEMESFIRSNNIDIAILAIPKESANEVAQTLTKAGVKGILNFAPLDLEKLGPIPVENIHIIDKMLALSFMMKGS